jgi:polyisoprenoid-binding protein YceI
MNTFIIAASLLLSPLSSTTGGDDAPTRYPVDTETSTVNWEGTKVTGSHNGDIKISNGFVTLENGLISAATVVIDMNTINTLDLEGGSKESLDGHLKSDDFFGVETYPTATFELTGLNPLRGGENGANFSAQGTVTIKGRTENVAVPVKVEMNDGGVRISGNMVLDRSKFDVQFRSKSFFDAKELGDKLIYNDFTISFDLVAGK